VRRTQPPGTMPTRSSVATKPTMAS